MNAFAVVTIINGNYEVKSEWREDQLDAARKAFHTTCATLWNASDVATATVRLLDRNLNTFCNYVEEIAHEVEEPTGE